MRAGACRAHNPTGAAIQINVAPDQMNRCGLPFVRYRIAFPVNLKRLRRLKPPIGELLEKWQQPALSSQCGTGVGFCQFRRCILESRPRPEQAIPAAVNCFVELFARYEVIRF